MERQSYQPIDARIWPRFSGIRTFARLPYIPSPAADVDVVVVGFPFDTATSYRTGTRFGPEAIRSASALLRPYHLAHDVDVFAELACVDAGDVPVAPGDTIGTYRRAEDALSELIGNGAVPLVLGGDHSITLAELRVLAGKYGPLALVHLDAHGDTWDEYFGQQYFHGTTFRRAIEEQLIDPNRSVQAGLRGPLYSRDDIDDARKLGLTVLDADALRQLGSAGYGDLVREKVAGAPVFLTFDVDFCDPAYTPGTGTPEVGGFTSAEAQAYLRSLVGVQLVGADVVEVSPAYDGPGAPTALLAANAAWEILALIAVGRRVAAEASRVATADSAAGL
jgi:agmatinase